jgi:hypothetical protein
MRLPRSWWASLVSEGIFHLQLMHVGRALWRARLAAYKSDRRRRGGFLPLHLAFAVPASCTPAPEPFLPSRLCSWSCSCFQFLVPPPVRMAPSSPSPSSTRRRGSARRRRRWPWVSWWSAASWRRMWRGSPQSGSCRRRGNEFPTLHTATSSASCASTSAASRRRRAASCGVYATTMAWSCKTSRRTRSRRRPRSSASAKASWGSQ